MKQIIYITIIVLVFCSFGFSQINNSERRYKLIGEFNDTYSEWYKIAVERLRVELANDLSIKGLIRIRNDKDFRKRLNFLNKGLAFAGMDLIRINLIIVEEQENDTDVLIMQNCAEKPKCENCIVIRAMDIGKIKELFSPKVIKKKKKK